MFTWIIPFFLRQRVRQKDKMKSFTDGNSSNSQNHVLQRDAEEYEPVKYMYA